MFKIYKKTIKRIFNLLGFEIRKKPKFGKVLDYNDIYKIKLTSVNPIIFDIGGNKGQSIERFLKCFSNPKIYSFEPNPDDFKYLVKKYQNNKNIILNNIALGDEISTIPLNVSINTGNSSFYAFKKNTEWMRIRSNQFNTTAEKYIEKIVKVNCTTVNSFCQKNKIDKIDLLKIDTQGYEDKILSGSSDLIDKKKIEFIELEIMLDEVYEKTMSFYDIESKLSNNYKLYGIDYQGFKNLSEGYMFAIDALYKKIK